MVLIGSATFITRLYSGNWLFRPLEPTGLAAVELTVTLAVFSVTIHLLLKKEGEIKCFKVCQETFSSSHELMHDILNEKE